MVLGKHGESESEEASLLKPCDKTHTIDLESHVKSCDQSQFDSANNNGDNFNSSYEKWPEYRESYGAGKNVNTDEKNEETNSSVSYTAGKVKLRSPVMFKGRRSVSPSLSYHSNTYHSDDVCENVNTCQQNEETNSSVLYTAGKSKLRSPVMFKGRRSVSPSLSYHSNTYQSDDACANVNTYEKIEETDASVLYTAGKAKLRSPVMFKGRRSVSPSLSYHSNTYQSDDALVRSEANTPGLVDGAQNDLYQEIVKKDEDVKSIDGSSPAKSFSFKALSRAQKMALLSFALADFGTFLCLSLMAPFFPKEARAKGVNDTLSGWIFGVFALTQFLTAPFFGKLLPYVGLKFMYISGLFIAGGCTVIFGFMTYVPVDEGSAVFVVLCFLIRIVLALGCSANQTACYSLVAKLFPDNVGTVFGMGEVFVGLGFMSGPPIGGALYGLGGFQLPFWVTGGVILLTVPPNFWIIPSSKEEIKKNEGPSMFLFFKSLSTLNNCLCVMVAAMVWSILDPTLEPHLTSTFNLGPELIGLLFLLMAAFYALSSPIWGWVADRMPDNRVVLVPGFLGAGAGMLFLGPSKALGFTDDDSELWMNILCLVVLGVTGSAALIPTFDIFLVTAEKLGFEDDMHTNGMVAGLWGSMYAFGDFLGPALGGFLLDTVGFSWCTTYTAFACFFMAFMLLITMLFESKCCKSCQAVCCCCPSKRKQSIEPKFDAKATETTPLLTETTEFTNNLDGGDLLISYPPKDCVTRNV